MNQKIIYGVGAGVLVLVVAGYFYAANKGVEEFEDFLYENDLSDVVRYRDVGYSPVSDAIDMDDIDFEFVLMDFGRGNKQMISGRMESLTIEGATADDGRSISFTGYVLATDPSESDYKENILYGFLSEPLKVVHRMGIDEARLNGSVAYDYDSDEKTLDLRIGLSADKLGSYEIRLSLNRARKLVDIDVSDVFAKAMMNPTAQLEEFGKIELVSFDASIEDQGLIENIAYVENLSSFSYANALNNGTPIDASLSSKRSEKIKRELDGILDEDGLAALDAFQSEGGDLKIAIRTERPVPLAKLVKNDKLHRDISIEVDR